MHARIRIGILVCFCLTLSTCGKKNNSQIGTPRIDVSPNQANIIKGESLQFSAVEISTSGAIVNSTSFVWASDDETIVQVDGNGMATAIKVGVARITATSGTVTGSALVGVVSPSPGQPFTLSGKAEYEDPMDQNGNKLFPLPFPLPTQPIRNAVIKVIAIDGFAELASDVTDNAGNYDFTSSPIGDPSKRGGAYVQVVTQTDPDPANPTQIKIRNNVSEQALLSVISSAFDNSTGTTFIQDVLAPAASVGGAFNILDVFSKGSELIESTGLCPPLKPAPPCPLPLLTGYWEPGGSEGTFFTQLSNQDNAIFLCGGGESDKCTQGDKDEYDDAIIAHEYGHFVLSQFSHDDSPGGIHFINQNNQDIRLSWSEGWANFFSGAARSDPIYVDTTTTGSFSFDLENEPSAFYTTSELAVAGVLWDVLDGLVVPLSTDGDSLDLTFDQILQTVMNIPTFPTIASMESFWLAFETLHSTFIPELQTIMFDDRKIELFPDDGDKVGEQDLIAGTPAQHHTLYQFVMNPFGDIDTIFFDVIGGQSYTLETFNLTNGADTFLTIKDSMGNTLFTNDNWNGISYLGCGVNPSTGMSTCPLNGIPPSLSKEPLSSSITWTATLSEQLSVEVKRSPIAPSSAGQFGSYDIKLTTP